MRIPVKVAITGTHSTGKSTFLNELESNLTSSGVIIGRIDDLARRARELGFPILQDHTYESTLWIMAEALRQEAVLSLSCDVILVDRPLSDAFGYLITALNSSDREIPRCQLDELESMALKHSQSYDFLVATVLDPSIALGDGRDSNLEFRRDTAETIAKQLENWSLDHIQLSPKNRDVCLKHLAEAIGARLRTAAGL